MSEAPAVPTETVSLPGGGRMPLLGFGTWQLRDAVALESTATALRAGYRHLDTATVYRNEGEVGRAIADSGVRDEVFLTTKLPPRLAGRERETLRQSLDLLGTDRVDLWLIHAPSADGHHVSMWEALLAARAEGLATDVGVSNFSLEQVDDLTTATGVSPAVNQIEWSPLLHDPAVAAGHRTRGVVLEGYSGLRGGILEHEVVRGIAEGTGRTPAQVVLRWHLQHGVVVIPRSSRPDRVRANADLDSFELAADDMAALDELGRA